MLVESVRDDGRAPQVRKDFAGLVRYQARRPLQRQLQVRARRRGPKLTSQRINAIVPEQERQHNLRQDVLQLERQPQDGRQEQVLHPLAAKQSIRPGRAAQASKQKTSQSLG